MSVTKFKSGLRGKSIILAIIATLILAAFFLLYAHPEQEQRIVSSFTQTAQKQLQTLSTIIVTPLLKKHYALLYETIDNQIIDNPNWKRIKLVNQSGMVIYPLIPWADTLKENDVLLQNDIVFLDENLGSITLIANYSDEIVIANNLHFKIIAALLTVLLSMLLIVLMLIDKTITKPLSHLSDAFTQLSKQNFNYVLPATSQDEVGDVSREFKVMRDNIAQYQNDLLILKEAAEDANKKLMLSARVFNEVNEGITITDSNGTIIDVNPTFCEITGYSREEVIGQNHSILKSEKQSPDFYAGIWKAINEQGHWQGEMWNRKKNGELYAELLTISTLRDKNEEIVNYVSVFADITQSKKQQETLKIMAHYDVLTGLPNRSLFSDRFTQAIAHSKRTESQVAICFLDLDNFKPINDNYGHDVGDQLLVEVAARIKACIREEDTVSRQGGDEFTLLLCDIESYAHCEKTLKRIHNSLAQPYLIDDSPHNVTVSSGITLYPSDEGDVDTLIRHADHAMYQSKQSGRNRYHFFNTQQDQQTIREHHRLDEIRQAFTNNEFSLYYQPKVNMATGDVFGAEALIRWIHPEKGLIPPLNFLPIIERTELEIQIGDWVINQALKQLYNWQEQGIKLEVSINISSHHLQSNSFFTQLEGALTKFPAVDSSYLQLEILESSVLSDLNTIRSIIKTCQNTLGLIVALDDFGTGFSSLTHLRSLSANIIKIDQSFVRDMLDDPNDCIIINGVIGLADSFNRKVIAEGVELTEQGLMLLVMGCDKAQGYGIAKPMPALDIPVWLNNYTANQEWITCAKKISTHKEKKIKFLMLTLKQWQKYYENNIQSSPDSIEHWPIMRRTKCHCGIWIKRAKQEQIFEESWLKNLDEVHESMHNRADKLFNTYQNGEINTARDGLKDIQLVFEKMNTILESWK